MKLKKISYEDALARFRHSLEVKRAAEKRLTEEFKNMGLKGTVVTL